MFESSKFYFYNTREIKGEERLLEYVISQKTTLNDIEEDNLKIVKLFKYHSEFQR